MILLRIPIINIGSTHTKNTNRSPNTIYSGLMTVKNNITPKYECDCSKKHMEEALIAIGKEELEKIINEDEKAELMCHFCNKKYQFSKDELLEIYNK